MPCAFLLCTPEASPSATPSQRPGTFPSCDPAMPCSPRGPTYSQTVLIATAVSHGSPFSSRPVWLPHREALQDAAPGQVQFHKAPFICLSIHCPHTKVLEHVHWAWKQRFLPLIAVSKPAFLVSQAPWKAAATFMHQTYQPSARLLSQCPPRDSCACYSLFKYPSWANSYYS